MLVTQVESTLTRGNNMKRPNERKQLRRAKALKRRQADAEMWATQKQNAFDAGYQDEVRWFDGKLKVALKEVASLKASLLVDVPHHYLTDME